MKDSGVKWIGQIPEDWDMTPNRYLFIDHSTKVGEQAHKYQLLSLTTMGVKEKDMNATGGKVPESYDNYQTVEPGDMIFCLFDLDCSAVFSGLSNYSGMITSAYDVLKPNHNYLDNLFADFWFQYVFSNRYYKIYSKNIRYTVTTDMFKSIMTPIPPIETQRKIGHFLYEKLTQAEDLISNQQAQIEKLKEYKQAIITEAVTKGLDKTAPMKDSGVEWIGEIPESWEINRIKYVSTYNDESLSDKTDAYLEINYVDIGAVSYENGIEKIEKYLFGIAPSRARRITRNGDVIISTVRTYLKAITRIDKDNLIVSTGFCVLRPYKILNKYVEYFCKSKCFTECVACYSVGINYPAIKASDLVGFIICQPNFAEQQQIADYLDKKCADIDSLISIKQQKIEKLQEYKKSLIYEYVTGKKEVAS